VLCVLSTCGSGSRIPRFSAVNIETIPRHFTTVNLLTTYFSKIHFKTILLGRWRPLVTFQPPQFLGVILHIKKFLTVNPMPNFEQSLLVGRIHVRIVLLNNLGFKIIAFQISKSFRLCFVLISYSLFHTQSPTWTITCRQSATAYSSRLGGRVNCWKP